MVPIADGSDLGGSDPQPGLVLQRRRDPARSPGRVASTRPGDAWDPMSLLGPMARSTDDSALLLAAIAGPDPRAPLSLDRRPGAVRDASRRATLAGARIAWSETVDGLPIDPAVTRGAGRRPRAPRSGRGGGGPDRARPRRRRPGLRDLPLARVLRLPRRRSPRAPRADQARGRPGRRAGAPRSAPPQIAAAGAPAHRALPPRRRPRRRIRRDRDARRPAAPVPGRLALPGAGRRGGDGALLHLDAQPAPGSRATTLPALSVPAAFTDDGLPGRPAAGRHPPRRAPPDGARRRHRGRARRRRAPPQL